MPPGDVICRGEKHSVRLLALESILLMLGLNCLQEAVQNHLFCATVVMFLNLSMDGTSRCGDKGVVN